MNTNNVKQALEDIQLDSATDQKILQKVQRYNRSHSKKKKALVLKRGFVPVVLCVAIVFVMIMEIPTYALMGFKARFFWNNSNLESDSHTGYWFTIDDSVKIDFDKVTGQVNECKMIMKQQWLDYDMFSSQHPFFVSKEFETYKEVEEYIGYQGLNMPQLELNLDCVEVDVQGDNDCNIIRIDVWERYMESDSLIVYSRSCIFSEEYPYEVSYGEGSESGDDEVLEFSHRKKIKNGRVFYVFEGTGGSNQWMIRSIYWEENGVIYDLHIRYKADNEEMAEEITKFWMNGF